MMVRSCKFQLGRLLKIECADRIHHHSNKIFISRFLREISLRNLHRTIDLCMLRDRPALRRRLSRLESTGIEMNDSRLVQLQRDIADSAARLSQRKADLPRPQFPNDLPITAKKAEIARTIETHQVVIISGETGSGKTTQLPKICLELGRGLGGMIGHTQPRRIAARSVAARIAGELDSALGSKVGYRIRFTERVQQGAYIKLMTDGILLTEIQYDRLLLQYDTLIIDEAHERSLNIDFLLGYLQRILPRRPELKLIITSATIDPHNFARYFGNAPVIEVSGRGYPVELCYRPLICEEHDDERDLQQGILEAVDELGRSGRGDILIFLPGERYIRDTAEKLRKHHPPGAEILPLYARLSVAEQNRIFQPHGHQRIVLATNVAETSLTVPGIKYVIDSGIARISRYSVRSKVQRLHIEPISQASARQRAGRCGRTSPGICIRLYSEQDFDNRAAFTPPEIQRANLASVILQMDHLRVGNIESFPFLDPPEHRQINDGYKLLEELGAIERRGVLTKIGQQLARLPIDPRLGRMILASSKLHCLREVLIIVSALAAQDPRDRPMDQREAADEKHKLFNDDRSDFLSFLKLWDFLYEQQKHLSKTKFRKLCRQHFISVTRVLEWQDIHSQLRNRVSGFEMQLDDQPAEYTAIHRALLHGLLSHIGFKDKDQEYRGARNRGFWIFPGSALYGGAPKWVMAAELIETTRLFARTVAKIESQWVVEAAQHLIKREQFEPHWQPRSAQVGGFERISLYGLVIVPRRRINYGSIAPDVAREIFIREALIAGRYQTHAKFFSHNHALIAKLNKLEEKARRRDILVSDEVLYEFYSTRIPANIHSGRTFEKWLKTSGQESALYLTEQQLVRLGSSPINDELYPEQMKILGTSFPLTYHFEPGSEQDGVTLTVPLALLNQVDSQQCEWLVPGMLQEKIMALIKGLPKQLRRNFVPVPDFARACAEAMQPYSKSLPESLSQALQRMTGIWIPDTSWPIESLSDHLRMRFRVIDMNGKTIGLGRNLASLQRHLASEVAAGFRSALKGWSEREGVTDWDFGNLNDSVEIEHSGVKARAYPALIDLGKSVALRLLDTPQKAYKENRKGVVRLYLLKLNDQARYLRKNLRDIQLLCLRYQNFGGCETLKTELIETVFARVFTGNGTIPTTRTEFEQRLNKGRPQLVSTLSELCDLVGAILEQYYAVKGKLKDLALHSKAEAISSVNEHLAQLVYVGFIKDTPYRWLGYLPRYLQAVSMRLDRLEYAPEKEAKLREQIEPYWERVKTRLAKLDHGVDDEYAFVQYRWMLEEFRVSLFAQSLGTSIPISAKRLETQWREVIGKSL